MLCLECGWLTSRMNLDISPHQVLFVSHADFDGSLDLLPWKHELVVRLELSVRRLAPTICVFKMKKYNETC